MTKKIIVTNTGEDDDEHTYYAIVFIQPDITMSKRLELTGSKHEATFTFWSSSPLEVGEKFLVILISVEESEETDGIKSKFVAKAAGNTDTIEFDFHP